MSIDWAEIASNTMRVLAVGVLLGAGLPALFAAGISLWDRGEGGAQADGTITRRSPVAVAMAYTLFALIGVAVLVGLLYLMRSSIDHYLGITLF